MSDPRIESVESSTREVVWTTDNVCPADRAEFWSNAIARSEFSSLELTQVSRDFHARLQVVSLDRVAIRRIDSCGQRVRQHAGRISQQAAEFASVVLQVRGHGHCEQDGRSCVLSPGSFTVLDGARDYAWQFRGDFSQLIVSFPRDATNARWPGLLAHTATVISGQTPGERLFFSVMSDAAAEASFMRDCNQARATENVLVQAIGLCPAFGREVASDQWVRRAIAVIETQLGDPNLQASTIASRLGVSRRYLDRLFRDHLGVGVAGYVRKRRMERARAALLQESESSQLSITDIAYAVGYSDSAAFSRAFRRHWGSSPRHLRTRVS